MDSFNMPSCCSVSNYNGNYINTLEDAVFSFRKKPNCLQEWNHAVKWDFGTQAYSKVRHLVNNLYFLGSVNDILQSKFVLDISRDTDLDNAVIYNTGLRVWSLLD